MKQVTQNSKLGLPVMVAFFAPATCIQILGKDDTQQTAAGSIHCSGAAKWMMAFPWRSFQKWFSCILGVTLIGALALFGCTSKDSGDFSGGQVKQMPQQQGTAAAKPVHKEVGEASWYGPGFQGQETANGETFNQKDMTAAHPSLPMGTMAKVTNLENGKKIEVRINDRGPFKGDRAIDLSSAAAKKIDMKKDGTTQVKIETKSTLKKKGSAKRSRKTRVSKKATPAS